ncbi:hypothetical protein PVAP13_4NG137422, partial [Panicum virgatum]
LTGIKCSRCTKRGHAMWLQNAFVYCVICDVAHAVGYAVHGLSFYHISHSPLPRSKKESKSAIISVVGEALSKEQVVSQLQRIFPGKWVWKLFEHEQNVYITKFPSKSDLHRAIAFGGADVKDVNGAQVIGDHYFELEFEVEKIGVDENRYEMEIGWVGGDDDGEGNEEKRFKNDGSESRDPKRQKNSGKVEQEGEKEHEREGEYTENIGQNCSLSLGSVAFLEKVNNMSEEVFEAFLRKKADAILDGVVSKIVGEIADKVIAEQNEVGKSIPMVAAISEAVVSPTQASPRLVGVS